MWKPTPDELQEILAEHDKWLCHDPDGERADLRYADLSFANLSGVNLAHACLNYSNLYKANLSNSNLEFADVQHSNLCSAILTDAFFTYADLNRSNLSGADLCGASLCGANLSHADLHDAKNVNHVYWNSETTFYPLQCPESGSFIGYKKANRLIVKLEICEDALRSSATSRKCRCSKARVLGLEYANGTPAEGITHVSSSFDHNFVYEIGKIVEVPNFDTNRWNECAPGIHFFLTREEAVKYTG